MNDYDREYCDDLLDFWEWELSQRSFAVTAAPSQVACIAIVFLTYGLFLSYSVASEWSFSRSR